MGYMTVNGFRGIGAMGDLDVSAEIQKALQTAKSNLGAASRALSDLRDTVDGQALNGDIDQPTYQVNLTQISNAWDLVRGMRAAQQPTWKEIFAVDAAAQRVTSGMGGYVSDADKNQISKWADAASKNDDQGAYNAAIKAMVNADDWGPAGPNWYTSVSNGGWYAYRDITTMMSTTIAQRHPEWLTVAGMVIGTGATMMAPAARVSPWGQGLVNSASDAAVNAAGEAGQNIANTASSGAVAAEDAAKKATNGLMVVAGIGAAVLIAMSFAKRRGMRAGNPFMRRTYDPPRRARRGR